ncbi:MAG: hypothetical protein M3N97_14860 [Pseudomonadota bacterium]|nr:hypothetical protein [Pseudomonadota bacterium]
MPDTISHITAIPSDPEDRARQSQRIEQAVSMLRESPHDRAFVADEERAGVTQVTTARRISADRICIVEMGFTAGNWDPDAFQTGFDKSRALS